MNNITKLEQHKCVGCGSCESVCPQNCISMNYDTEGFLYPLVSSTECSNCSLCVQHCPILSDIRFSSKYYAQKIYAMKLKDKSLLSKSSSGGVFAGIASYILDQGGIVFGCAFDEALQVHHISIDSKDDISLLQGSKYIASDMGSTYKQVKLFMEQGKMVLYSGLPCQIAGLKAYISISPSNDNLITIDLICEGTPSQKLFNKYLTWLEEKNHGKIIYYGFRDKDVGGWNCGGKIKTKTKTKTKTINAICDPYFVAFLRGETYRPSCYHCIFANMNRPGDITIGDFWGIGKIAPQFYSTDGVSICIINNDRGLRLFNNISKDYKYITISVKYIEEIQKYNSNLKNPPAKPRIRETIYDNIDKYSSGVYIKNLKLHYKDICNYYIRYILITFLEAIHLKNFIKRILKK
jgi:coenzyme F420-reducing hydrogenase beta subunit